MENQATNLDSARYNEIQQFIFSSEDPLLSDEEDSRIEEETKNEISRLEAY